MTSTTPLISVVMTSYHHEQYVEEAVKSVWDQSYPNLEMVVVDDASTDRTFEILERLKAKAPMPMRVDRNPNNLGPNVTQRRAVEMAQGKYVAFLASDDAFLPGRFESQVEVLNQQPEVMIVYANGWRVSEGRKVSRLHGDAVTRLMVQSPREVLNYLYTHKGPLFLQTALVRRNFFLEAGGNDVEMIADDMVLNIRMFRHLADRGRFAYVDLDAAIYRIHGANLHHDLIRQSRGRIEAFKKYTPVEWKSRAIGDSYWQDALRARTLGLPRLSIKYFLLSQGYFFLPRRWWEFFRGWMSRPVSGTKSEGTRQPEIPHPFQTVRQISIGSKDLEEMNRMLDWHAGTLLEGRLFGRLSRKPGKRTAPEPIPDPRIVTLNDRLNLQGKSVLEVGCFEGIHTVGLRMFTDRVTAIDLRPANVVKTLTRLSGHGYSADVFVKDAEALGPGFGTFDVIFHCGVLYHLMAPVPHVFVLGTMGTHLFLDTHVARDEKRLERVSWNGQTYRGAYHDERGWDDPFSGKEARGFWLTYESLYQALTRAGFSAISLLEERAERNGPRVALIASR